MRKTIAGGLLVALISTSALMAGKKEITIDLTDQKLTALEDGKVIFDTPVSTGRVGYETPTGDFKAYAKKKHNRSTLYPIRKNGKRGGAKMPYTIRVTGAYTIHEGTLWKDGEGNAYPASHGCIRVGKDVASKFYKWTDIGTPIKIVGKTPKYSTAFYKKCQKLIRERYYNDYLEWGDHYFDPEFTSIVYQEGDLDYLEKL